MKKIIMIGIALLLVLGFSKKVSADSLEETVVSFTLTGTNMERGTNMMILYTRNPQTNSYGYEILIDEDGYVIETAVNITYIANCNVISAHGTSRETLSSINVGDHVLISGMSVTVTRHKLNGDRVAVQRLYNGLQDEINNAKENFRNIDWETFNKYMEETVNVHYNAYIAAVDNFDTSLTGSSLTAQLNIIKQRVTNNTNVITTARAMLVESLPVEARAAWHRPNSLSYDENTLEGVQEFAAHLNRLNINMVFVETFWNGYVSYRSDIAETHPVLADGNYGTEYGNDYIKALIGECAKYDIEVHCWAHIFSAADFFDSSWLVENYQGTIAHPTTYGNQYYFDPSNEDVIDYLNSLIHEVMSNYDLAGFQYDYIRYYDNTYANLNNIRDSGFCTNANTKFMTQYGLSGDIRELVKDSSNRAKWNEWRQTQITNAVKTFSETIKEINPNLVISADVVGNIDEARNVYMQDWLTWTNNGYIDMLCPMIYTGSDTYLMNLVSNIEVRLKTNTFQVTGIAPIYYEHGEQANQEQIIGAVAAGAAGSAMFATHNVLGNSKAETLLINGTNRETAVSPFASGRMVVEATIKKIKQYLDVLYTYYEKVDATTYRNILANLNSTLAKPCTTPSEILSILENDLDLIYIQFYAIDPKLADQVSVYIDYADKMLNTKINRTMINLGYYNPATQNSRPSLDNLEFEAEDATREVVVLQSVISNTGGGGGTGGETGDTPTTSGCSCNDHSSVLEILAMVNLVGLVLFITRKRDF